MLTKKTVWQWDWLGVWVGNVKLGCGDSHTTINIIKVNELKERKPHSIPE